MNVPVVTTTVLLTNLTPRSFDRHVAVIDQQPDDIPLFHLQMISALSTALPELIGFLVALRTGERTLGPFRAFNILNWIAVAFPRSVP
jgi:hypothetical protein